MARVVILEQRVSIPIEAWNRNNYQHLAVRTQPGYLVALLPFDTR
jgi:hypothetical protein